MRGEERRRKIECCPLPPTSPLSHSCHGFGMKVRGERKKKGEEEG